MDTKFADVIDNDEIGPVAGRDRTASEQTVMPRRDERRLAPAVAGGTPGHDAAQQAVDVPAPLQVVGKDVVGHQAPAIAQLPGGQERQQSIQIEGGRPFTHLHQHPQPALARASSTVADS